MRMRVQFRLSVLLAVVAVIGVSCALLQFAFRPFGRLQTFDIGRSRYLSIDNDRHYDHWIAYYYSVFENEGRLIHRQSFMILPPPSIRPENLVCLAVDSEVVALFNDATIDRSAPIGEILDREPVVVHDFRRERSYPTNITLEEARSIMSDVSVQAWRMLP
jgi:hypothetical protein